MKFLQLLSPVAGLMAVTHAGQTDASTVYTTVVTTAYETYCPSPTTFVHHNVTYTATSATTLTITSKLTEAFQPSDNKTKYEADCPCTITTRRPPPYTTTKTLYPPHVNTTLPPPEVTSTTIKTIKTTKPTYYHNTTSVEHTPKPPKPSHSEEPPKPPKPSHHANITSTTVIVVTPPATTIIGSITPVTQLPPTKTPVGPTTTRPVVVSTAAAEALGAGAGVAAVAGLFALLI
ncbi:Clock-controlled protein 6-like protein 1 [Colletotrichum chlorophyti]|uniref:Clock-controlled protein 6-like protein 1 n=1 Tax=Colletotrichum chlorophyti TaxID=708187 RepID=A0A1Q8RKN0_9PEZI|nr:Clock-controlled protein 6-like protein 1 [Colletotrichum chlorophyti]